MRLQAGLEHGMRVRPNVGGFPYLAEALRLAGVKLNVWTLPACQSLYVMDSGNVVQTMPSLVNALADVPAFNKEALVRAIRNDQSGLSTFPEFLRATWEAGVVRYVVDFDARTVVYEGVRGEDTYAEAYPKVDL